MDEETEAESPQPGGGETPPLQDAVDEALKKPAPRYPALNPSSRTAAAVEILAGGSDNVEKALLAHLPSIRRFCDAMVYFDRSGTRMNSKQLAGWAVWRARTVGSAQAIAELVAFAETSKAKARRIVALQGVSTDQTIEIAEGFSLIPFDKVPRCSVKDELDGVSTGLIPNPLPPGRSSRPSAAIVHEYDLSISTEEPPSNRPEPIAFKRMRELSFALTLCGPSPTTIAREWTQIDDSSPVGQTIASSSSPLHDVRANAQAVKLGEDDLTHLRSYLNMDSPERMRLNIAIHRLNLALRRSSEIDQAIELGIALEALLNQGTSKDAPISYLIRLRGAMLHGGAATDREECAKWLNEAYSLRSKAVHSGILPASTRVKGIGKVTPKAIIERTIKYCHFLILKIVELGQYPRWDQLMLNHTVETWPPDAQ